MECSVCWFIYYYQNSLPHFSSAESLWVSNLVKLHRTVSVSLPLSHGDQHASTTRLVARCKYAARCVGTASRRERLSANWALSMQDPRRPATCNSFHPTARRQSSIEAKELPSNSSASRYSGTDYKSPCDNRKDTPSTVYGCRVDFAAAAGGRGFHARFGVIARHGRRQDVFDVRLSTNRNCSSSVAANQSIGYKITAPA